MVPRLLTLSLAAAALDPAAGKALFQRAWVQPSSSVRTAAGLGPLYDARSCGECHVDGGPGPAGRDGAGEGLVLRLGDAGGREDPVYGAQLQRRAVPGLEPEARVTMSEARRGMLRTVRLSIAELGYGPLAAGVHASPRRAPSLSGVGELAAVPDEAVLAQADRERSLGVAGRPSWLTGPNGRRLGRWGWKASQADLSGQVASALQRDIGVSTPGRPGAWGDCTPMQRACREAAMSGSADVEASDAETGLIVSYLDSLARPRPVAAQAPEAFRRAGCDDCHAALTARDGREVPAYTDLLLHDMGPGLDDGVGEAGAAPREWRTAPLWNLKAELAAGGLLHDGRARSVAEAVRWHGGQASRSRARFFAMSGADRAAIDQFLLEQ
jgi:CxxC motif-containing protein (DUF1111 family)